MNCDYTKTKSQPHFFLIFNFQLIKMFSDELEKISWEETTKAIYSKTDADVRRALGKKSIWMSMIYGIDLTCRHSLSGSDGPPQPEIYDGAVRQNNLYVCAALYHQFMHQLLRLLRFPYQQSDEKNDSDRGGNRQRIQSNQTAGSF